MSPLALLLQRVRAPTWQYALLGGLASIPLTLALQLQSPTSTWNSSGIVLCALAAGYLAKRRGLESTPIGARAGAIGAFPVSLSLLDRIPFVVGLAQPAWFAAVQLLMVVAIISVLVSGIALAGGIAGRLGGWLAERGGHPRAVVGY